MTSHVAGFILGPNPGWWSPKGWREGMGRVGWIEWKGGGRKGERNIKSFEFQKMKEGNFNTKMENIVYH